MAVTIYDFLEYALLALSVLFTLLGCIGIMVVPGLYDRMHYMALATSVGAILLAAAVVVQEAAQPSSGKAIIAALVVAVTSPLLTHATMRAARTHHLGHWAGPENAPQTVEQDEPSPVTEEV
jgi:multicomponent Na+:H+ antiporter subunit G